MRALAAAGAAQVTVRVTGARFQPRLSTAGAQVTLDQFMAERQRRFRPLALVAGADRGAFFIIHQRQVDRRRHRALAKLHRGAYVNQWRIAGENGAIIRPIGHGVSSEVKTEMSFTARGGIVRASRCAGEGDRSNPRHEGLS